MGVPGYWLEWLSLGMSPTPLQDFERSKGEIGKDREVA